MLRLLFFVSDTLTANVRLLPLLNRLQFSGTIRLACVDRDMQITGETSDRYDVLLAHRNLSVRQTAWLRSHENVPFVYDIDDLLLEDSGPSSSEKRISRRRAAQQDSIRLCLARASIVTSPSPHLISELRSLSFSELGSKTRVLPNPGQELISPPKYGRCRTILWTSSAAPMIAPDLEEACYGIAEGAKRTGLSLLLIGKFSPSLKKILVPRRAIEWLDPEAYLELLRDESMIAVAPLSRCLPAIQQRFANCKSDIKIAHYASSRIDGAYSDVPPFASSELPKKVVIDNSREAWRDAIVEMSDSAPQAGNVLAERPAVLARRPSQVAKGLYEILVEAAASRAQPFPFWSIPTPRIGRQIEAGLRSLAGRLKPMRHK